MRRAIALGIMLLIAMCTLSACGKTYTCRKCDKSTSKIYYDIDGNAELCADCAKSYWAPFDYKEYRAE